jgi:hypothetical protein
MKEYDPSNYVSGRTKRPILKRKVSNRSAGVARRLGLQRVLTPRSFTSQLGLAARRVGGKSHFMELARLSRDERIRGLVSRWNCLSRSDRRYISLEDLCEAYGVEPAELYGAVVAACYAAGRDTTPLLKACYAFQEVVRATVRGALKERGAREREKIFKRMGLLSG